MQMTFPNLFMVFLIYGFLGYLCEVIYVKILDKKFVNRGFLFGPICPIYGFGGSLVLLLLHKFIDNPLLVFILSIFITSTIEYITSWLLEKIFMYKWWDYSKYPYNLNGRVCLKNSLLFGIASIVMVYVINPKVIQFLNNFTQKTVDRVSIILFIILIIDVIYSVISSINLRKGLVIAKKINTGKIKQIPENIEKAIKDQINNLTKYPYHFLRGFPHLKKANTEVFDTIKTIKRKEKESKKPKK